MNQPANEKSLDGVSRRDFIKTSSSAAVGGSLLAALAGCKTGGSKSSSTAAATTGVHAKHNDTLKIALIGCGGRGSGAADQALSTSGPIKIVAMADVFKDRLEGALQNLKDNAAKRQQADRIDVSEDCKFVGFDAYKKAIALADVVILATPPGFRPMQFEEAVRQGKHIFMEKPVATDAPGVRKVLAAAEEAKKKNLKVGVGLQRHHQIGYLETLKRLHAGQIGDIVAMRAYWDGNTPWLHTREEVEKQYGRKVTEMEYQMRNWYYFTWICGDHIVEQHIHNLDVINWVKGGHPIRAQGMGGCEVRKGKDYGEIFDHHFVEFQYDDGSYLSSQCRHINNCFTSVSEHVVGTKGVCDVSGHLIRGQKPWRYKAPDSGDPNPYQVEHDDLFNAIRNDTPYNEAEYGAISSMTAIFGRMATYSGKMLEWKDALNSNISLFPSMLAWDADMPVKPMANGFYKLPVPGTTVVI